MVGGLWYAESWVYSVLKRTHVKQRPFCPLSEQNPPCRPTHPPLPEVGWVLLGPVPDIDSGVGGGGVICVLLTE